MIAALSAGRDAPKELRTRLAFTSDQVEQLLRRGAPGVGELVILSTCHRTELYATGDGSDSELVHAMAATLPGLKPTDQHDLRYMQGAEAVSHLFRVASGLDSLVIGESQVLGQVRRALNLATDTGALGPVLSSIFQRAIRLGRKVRNETALGQIGASIGSIAVEYLEDRLEGLESRPGAIVGAGEAATDAALSARKAGAELVVVSRSLESAQGLAAEVEGRARPGEELSETLEEVEFAIVAVSGGTFIRSSELPSQFKVEPFPVLDLSVPPAFEMTRRPDIDLRTLEDIPGPRGPEVTNAVIEAESLVKREVLDVVRWADTREVGRMIMDLHDFRDRLVSEEVARTARAMDLDPEDEDKLRLLAARIAAKLFHGPTAELRHGDEQVRQLVRKMFRLDD